MSALIERIEAAIAGASSNEARAIAALAEVNRGLGAYVELEAAIIELDGEDRRDAINTLRECADDADYDEPSVGLFENPRMAHLFRSVACLIEQVSA